MRIKPQYIVISGIDGSGKTSVISGLQKALSSQGLSTNYVWLRYNHILVKPIHAISRVVGLSKRHDSRKGRVWRHEFYKNQLFCSFYIVLTFIDTWLGRWRALMLIARHKKLDYVICDRWVNDILIDLAVDSRRPDFLSTKWFYLFQNVMPSGTKQFLLTRDAESILECRPESRDDPDFFFRMQMYDKLKVLQGGPVVVSNDRSIDRAVREILFYINR